MHASATTRQKDVTTKILQKATKKKKKNVFVTEIIYIKEGSHFPMALRMFACKKQKKINEHQKFKHFYILIQVNIQQKNHRRTEWLIKFE